MELETDRILMAKMRTTFVRLNGMTVKETDTYLKANDLWLEFKFVK
ncbi:hypothetical protein [Furfurilactobacillus entadae]